MHAADDFDEDYLYETSTLEWMIDKNGRNSIDATFKDSEDSPAFSGVEKFKVGFDVKF